MPPMRCPPPSASLPRPTPRSSPPSALRAWCRRAHSAATDIRPVELGGMLLSGLEEPDGREAVRIGDAALTYAELHAAAGAVADRVAGMTRVAVWAEPRLETVVAVVGAL